MTDREKFEAWFQEAHIGKFQSGQPDPLRKSMCTFDYVDHVTQNLWEAFLAGRGTMSDWYPNKHSRRHKLDQFGKLKSAYDLSENAKLHRR